MKQNFSVLFYTALFVLFLHSCKKPEDNIKNQFDPASVASSSSSSQEFLIDVSDQNIPEASTVQTILGEQYTFPFKTEIIKQAFNELSENDIAALEPTHNYIKFTPTNLEELELVLASKLPVFDFPLDRYITQYGSTLQGSTASTIPVLYTFAPVGTTLPNVSHQILYTVYFTQMESIVTERAFQIAGLQDSYPYKRDEAGAANSVWDNIPENIGIAKDIDIKWKKGEMDAGMPYEGGPGNYTYGVNFDRSTPSDVANACSCERNGDDRDPSGCILVEETQFQPHWQGVRKVAVDFLGPYGQYDVMWTNDQGCFKSSRRMRYKVWRPFASELRLPVFMRVAFTSHDVTVRSLIPTTLALAASPTTHWVGNAAPWGLNNITIRYNRSANAWQVPCVYYTAATVNNAHYEYCDMSWADGIEPLKHDNHYLLNPLSFDGSAPMFHQLVKSGQPKTIIQVGYFTSTFNMAFPAMGSPVINYIQAFPPDILIGMETNGDMNRQSSDQKREIMYHEMAHATHYRKCGNQIWLDNIAYIAAERGKYGDGTRAGADKCALIEMWGQHIGYTYCHRRYGGLHSKGHPILDSWFKTVESELGWPSNAWMPGGLLHDMMDNNVQNRSVDTRLMDNIAMGPHPGPGPLDNVAGFTNKMFHDQLGSGTGNIHVFKTNLKNSSLISTGNNATDYDVLWGLYGY